MITAYLAPRGYEYELQAELAWKKIPVLEQKERIFLTDGSAQRLAWAQNTWLEPFFIPITSVSDGVRQLKAIQRNWYAHPTDFFRRSQLISEQLPPIRFRPHVFGEFAPSSPLGSWTLWDKDRILASARCSSPFPDGEVLFDEDKINPPSRAYLKLWETFTLAGYFPQANELALDLGACPGGWTWVLASCKAKVFSIDKAPLDPRVAAMRGVDVCSGSGFAAEPEILGNIDWLLSDMACYPERLWTIIEKWQNDHAAANMVCTLKLQGQTDYALLDRFAAVPDSILMHLSCNKHELSWIQGKIAKKMSSRC